MVLRPTRSAIARIGARYLVMVVPGALLVYAGWSSGVVVPALFGTPLVALGLLAFTNVAVATIRLDAGVLIGRTLLGRVAVPVDKITRILPIDLSYRRPPWTFWGAALTWKLWNRRVEMFEVWTSAGPTGLFLNPALYGEAAIQRLLDRIHIRPEHTVEDRFLDVFGKSSPRSQPAIDDATTDKRDA